MHDVAVSFKYSSPQLEVQRIIYDEWSPYLTHVELRVVWFIYNRTYRFNKSQEVIPIRHFLEGVSGDNFFVPGVQLKRRQVQSVIADLCDYRLLLKQSLAGHCTKFALNLNLTSEDLRANVCNKNKICYNRLQILGKNERDKGCRKLHYPRAENCTPTRAENCTPINKYNKTSNIKQATAIASATPRSGVESNMVKELEELETQTRIEHQKARMKQKKKLNPTGINKIWIDYMKEYYPSYPAVQFTAAELSQLHKTLTVRVNELDVFRFLESVIADWNLIISENFGFMRNPPKFPQPLFVVKYIATFISAYHTLANPGYALKTASNAEQSPLLKKAYAIKFKKLEKQVKKQLDEKDAELETAKQREFNLRSQLGKEREKSKSQKKRFTSDNKPVRLIDIEELPKWE